jgi:hypothetical protein
MAQIPREVVGDLDTEIVMRIDAAGATSSLCQAARKAGIGFHTPARGRRFTDCEGHRF